MSMRGVQAGREEAAALKTLVTGLGRRMDGDCKDSSFLDTLQAKIARQTMHRALGVCL